MRMSISNPFAKKSSFLRNPFRRKTAMEKALGLLSKPEVWIAGTTVMVANQAAQAVVEGGVDALKRAKAARAEAEAQAYEETEVAYRRPYRKPQAEA